MSVYQERPIMIKLHSGDNVGVALTDMKANDSLPGINFCCRESIPAGHKVALATIETGGRIFKYGQVMGFATRRIEPGEHVHVHNVEILDFTRDYAFCKDAKETEFVPSSQRAFFDGILRGDGRVATRNFIGVLSTVCCSSSISRFIADHFTRTKLSNFEHVDGVVAIHHGSGCTLPPDGEGLRFLQRALSGFARHPNFSGVLIVGLGCEVNHIDCLLETMNLQTGPNFRTLSIQQSGGTRETVRLGIAAVEEMLEGANQIRRERVSAEHLVLGLECGGSDGYSGISANPVLGIAADHLVRHGGTVILSETPEIYGAEHLLTRRAVSPEVGEKLIRRIRWWEAYAAKNNASINNNPTPGNKAGGLTTVLEKSLGAAAKGGSTRLNDVYEYAEPVTAHGLVFMDTPGHDLISITGMIAGGANLVCFTTGRGTVCGYKPVPTIKLATNSEMYHRMKEDMDVNCGAALDGDVSLDKLGEALFRLILETASGKKTKSELLGFGDNEFVPWPVGAVF